MARFTSASLVRQLHTLIRIAWWPRHLLPVKKALPSR